MASILNADFETWSGGTLFSDPSDGQQLADDWFFNKGGTSFFTQVARGTPGFSGSFCIVLETGTNGFGPNTNTYAYQDLGSYTDLLGLTIVVTVAAFSPTGGTGETGHLFVDDGVTVTASPSNAIDNTWTILTVTKTISPSATKVRIGLIQDVYAFANVQFDLATLSIAHVLNLSDSMAPSESLSNQETKHVLDNLSLTALIAKVPRKVLSDPMSLSSLSVKTAVKNAQDVEVMVESVNISRILGPIDTIKLNEWLHIELMPAGMWTDFDA